MASAAGWRRGCRMRLADRFDHQRAAELFETFEPTLFFGVPTIYVRLLDLPADAARRIGERARLFVSGSAPLPAQVFDAFRERFGHTILERYGMSETLMLISNPYEGERRAGHGRRAVAGRVGALRRCRRRAPAERRRSASVLVRGSNVFTGYWRRARGDSGGVSTTAGSGRAIWPSVRRWLLHAVRPRERPDHLGRVQHLPARDRGAAARSCPALREAAVVGAPDERRGEVPVAYVVAPDGFDSVAARGALRAHAGIVQGAARVHSRRCAARNALGKVQKHLLPPFAS